jgi:hypothetical protein
VTIGSSHQSKHQINLTTLICLFDPRKQWHSTKEIDHGII